MTEVTRAVPANDDELEAGLLSIMREVLKNNMLGPEDDFFLTGGHSLLATQLVIRLRKAFGVRVTLNDLFEAGTAARLAARVEELFLDEMGAARSDTTAGLGQQRA